MSPRADCRASADPARVRFEEAARVALANTQLRRNMGKATQTIRAKRAAVVAELPDWEALREAGRAIKERDAPPPRHVPDRARRRRSSAPAGIVHWARDAAEANRDRHRIAAEPRRHGGHQDQVADDRRDRPERGAGRGRHRGDRDRPGRADHPARRRAVVAHPRPGDPQEPLRDPRAVPCGRLGVADADRRARATAGRRGRATTCGASSSSAPVAVSGANFAVAETGTVCVVESEGNGRMCLTLPRVLISVMGIEKVIPDLAGPRGLPPAPAPLVDRRADEPVHLVLDRRDAQATGRRSSTWSCSTTAAPGSWPTRIGRQALELHPLQRLPEHLPGLRADRRPRLPLGLSRPDRRDPDAAARRRGERPLAPLRLVALRRLLRGLPGQDQHPRGPGPPPRARRPAQAGPRRPARLARPRGPGHEVPGARLRQPRALRACRRSSAGSASGSSCATGVIERLPGPLAGWTAMRDVFPVAAQTFREWWRTRS